MSNLNRFSKFFHCQKKYEIYYEILYIFYHALSILYLNFMQLYADLPKCDSWYVARTKSGSEKQATDSRSWVHWGSLISLLVFVDVVWFAHRMACTYSTVKLVLYGQIAYIECRPVTTGAPSIDFYLQHKRFPVNSAQRQT